MNNELTHKKIIIAGFPGVGKSTAAKLHPEIFYDAESSNFHWITTDDGERMKHPEWPANYVNFIRTMVECGDMEQYKDIIYICISTHEEVLSYLKELGVRFICLIPGTKEEAIRRYEARGSSPEFIKQISENYQNYIDSIFKHDMTVINLHEKYLSDVLNEVPYEELLKLVE